MRPYHTPHDSEPDVSAGTDPLTRALIQGCGETGMRGTDIRMLCPPRARPSRGHAAPGTGTSGFSAGLVSLLAIHNPSLNDSNGNDNSKVDAYPPCTTQIGVCPQS